MPLRRKKRKTTFYIAKLTFVNINKVTDYLKKDVEIKEFNSRTKSRLQLLVRTYIKKMMLENKTLVDIKVVEKKVEVR